MLHEANGGQSDREREEKLKEETGESTPALPLKVFADGIDQAK